MSHTSDALDRVDPREGSRIRSRDRKKSKPKMIVENSGLRKLTLELAQKRRQSLQGPEVP